MDLSTIIVSWNVEEQLRQCLQSIYAQGRTPVKAEVLVIDNASIDNTVSMITKGFPQVKLITNKENQGFAAANNQGICLAQGRYVMLLNPDTEIVGNALFEMMAYLDQHPEVGLVGPQLLNSDGTVQSSRRRFPTLATAFVESTILQRYLSRSSILANFYVKDKPDDITQEVDWLVGACLLVRSEVIKQVGMLDERFFMYLEEVDWCYRIKKAGWKIVYLPAAQVIHHYGQSADQNVPRRHIYFNDSKCKFYEKYYGVVIARMLRWFIIATFLFQMVEEGAKLALGHKRKLRRERLGVFWQVIRSGLRG